MERMNRWTYEDFCSLPEDGHRDELLDGVLVREPAPTTSHQRLVTRLMFLLGDQLGPDRRDGLLTSPLAVVLSNHTVLQPDVLYIPPEQLRSIREDAVHIAPALVIEVLSPSTRDRDLTAKRSLYAQFGVGDYWIVDPAGQLILVFSGPCASSYTKANRYTGGDVATSPSLDCRVSVRDLFAL